MSILNIFKIKDHENLHISCIDMPEFVMPQSLTTLSETVTRIVAAPKRHSARAREGSRNDDDDVETYGVSIGVLLLERRVFGTQLRCARTDVAGHRRRHGRLESRDVVLLFRGQGSLLLHRINGGRMGVDKV